MLPLAHALLAAVHPDLAKLALVPGTLPGPDGFIEAFTAPVPTCPVPPLPPDVTPTAEADRHDFRRGAGTR